MPELNKTTTVVPAAADKLQGVPSLQRIGDSIFDENARHVLLTQIDDWKQFRRLTNPTRCPFNANLFAAHVAPPTFVISLSSLRLLLQDRLIESYLSHQSLAGNHSLTGIIGGIPWKCLTLKILLPAPMIGFHHKANQTLRICLSLPS